MWMIDERRVKSMEESTYWTYHPFVQEEKESKQCRREDEPRKEGSKSVHLAAYSEPP
jgi:hypothetical protein